MTRSNHDFQGEWSCQATEVQGILTIANPKSKRKVFMLQVLKSDDDNQIGNPEEQIDEIPEGGQIEKMETWHKVLIIGSVIFVVFGIAIFVVWKLKRKIKQDLINSRILATAKVSNVSTENGMTTDASEKAREIRDSKMSYSGVRRIL